MSDVLLCDVVNTMKKNDKVDGMLYIQSYDIAMTKTNNHYIKGIFQGKGAISFKVWSDSKAYDILANNDCRGKIVNITGVVDDYNNSISLTVNSVTIIEESNEISYIDFLENIYDVDEYFNILSMCLTKYCSSNAMQVFYLILNDVEVKDSFRNEFAAISHHDSCKGGLLAHTTKVVKLMTVVNFYDNIMKTVNLDTLFITAALHDIGKCIEYNKGTMSDKGKVASHLTYGILIVAKYEMQIKQLMGNEFYYDLCAVITQHHGAYGDKPRTIYSYLVHMMDALDTDLSDIDATIRNDLKNDTRSILKIRGTSGHDGYLIRY